MGLGVKKYSIKYIQQIAKSFWFCRSEGIGRQSELVKAFIKVLSERRNIIKKGSRTGYFHYRKVLYVLKYEPHRESPSARYVALRETHFRVVR